MEEESKPLLSKSTGLVYQTTCRLDATPRVLRGRLIGDSPLIENSGLLDSYWSKNRTSRDVVRSCVSSASAIVSFTTLMFASSCPPEFEGIFPAARNNGILPVGILYASFYPF